jgi:hypothetical protein
MLEIFNSVTEVGNKSVGDKEVKKVTTISYNGTAVKRNSRMPDFNFDKYLTKYIEDDKNIVEINGINIKNIKDEWILQNIYVVENNQKLDHKVLLENIFENKCLIDFIKETKLDLNNFSEDEFQMNQLVNVLSCLRVKNKIIVFKNNFKFINKKYSGHIYKHVLPYIKNNNYVIFIS